MDVDSQRAGELFDKAVELGLPERTAFLKAECGSHPALKQRVEEMLAAAAAETTEPEGPERDLRAYVTARIAMMGDRIGRYKLLQKIGEGGCGIVYMAEQEEPVRRRVALKVIKRGMDTRQVIARFEAERQALAMMDHPNIAKVLDAGETETGQPFFVMELVRGLPITEYCDQEKLPAEERLKLFVEVCHALQHAHQKGIIHRDIKPSNVLVAFQDGAPVPKVIDFGIAKAIEARLTEKTLFTVFEQFMGTPAYMSPEQAEMSGIDIDTRSDIYSLGVLLYELLTGTTPFDTRELLSAGIDEIRRKIREEEPPQPSTRLSALQAVDLIATAKQRRMDGPKLISRIRGDLDWVVMKALEKDRTRRYETANGLAIDIQRHLSQEPVAARPISATYRLQKFIRRNKLAFAAASVVGLVLIIGGGVSAWQAVRATHAVREQKRLRANEANLLQAAEQARLEETKARRQAETNAFEVKNLLRQAYIGNASSQAERGDLTGSLPWLVEALKLATPGSATEKAIRMNLGTALERTLQLEFTKAFDKSEIIQKGNFDFQMRLGLRSSGVALSPDGRSAGVFGPLRRQNDTETAVILFDVMTGNPKGKPFLVKGEFNDLRFSSDNRRVMASGVAGVRVWDCASGELVANLEELGNQSLDTALPTPLGNGEFTGDSARLLVVFSHRAILWDLIGKKEVFSVDFKSDQGRSTAPQIPEFPPWHSAHWSPDGRFLAYTTDRMPGDNWIWDTTAQRRISLPKFNGRIRATEFSPDGRLLACFGSPTPLQPTLIQIVDTEKGEFVRTPDGFPKEAANEPYSITTPRAIFSPDSTRLIVLGEISPHIWDTRSWRAMGAPLKHVSRPVRVVFSAKGTKFATVTERGTLQLWDTQTGDPLTEPMENPLKSSSTPWFDSLPGMLDLNFSEDGQSLVFANGGAVSIFRVPEPGIRFLAGTNAVKTVHPSPDGKEILVLTSGGNNITDEAQNAALVDSTNGETKWRINGVSKAIWSSDGKTILSEDPSLHLWDATRGVSIISNITANVFHGRTINDLFLTMDCEYEDPQGQRSGFTGMSGDSGVPFASGAQLILPLKVTLFKLIGTQVTPFEEKAKIELNDSRALPAYATPNPDGDLLLLNRWDNTFQAYRITNGTALGPPVRLTSRIRVACFSPDRRKIAVLCADGSIGCWDVDLSISHGYLTEKNKKVIQPVAANTEPYIGFSADGAYLATRNEINRIVEMPNGNDSVEGSTLWQLFSSDNMGELFRPVSSSLLGLGETKSVSSQDSRGALNNSARVFDLKTRKMITPPLNHSAPVHDVRLSPNERLVATGSEDGTARVWDAETGEAVTPPLRHSAAVTAVAFFPDNARLLTGAADGSLRIWHCRSTDESVEDLETLTKVNSGRRVDTNGVLVPLPAEEMQAVLRAWSKKHPPRFATSKILQELESQLQVWEVLYKLRQPHSSILHFPSSATFARGKIGEDVKPLETVVRGRTQIMSVVIQRLREDFQAVGQLNSHEDRLKKLQQAVDTSP